MLTRIENAEPRSVPGSSWIPANKQDVVAVVEYLLPIVTRELGGSERTDLGIILDAGEIIGNNEWKEMLIRKSEEIQDDRLLEALQS